MSPLARLPLEVLRDISRALASGALVPPYAEMSVRRIVGATLAPDVAQELERLRALGMGPPHLAELARALDIPRVSPPELVWSGPDDGPAETRDTAVVLRGMFAAADRDVVIVGFALYQGPMVLAELAARMEQRPGLRVRMFLHVDRSRGDTSLDTELLREFAAKFRRSQWPRGTRVPEVFYDPRTLAIGSKRVSLHAKCVVIDGRSAFVTSANLTEAAQERNIEVGLRIDDQAIAGALVRHVDRLVGLGKLVRVPSL